MEFLSWAESLKLCVYIENNVRGCFEEGYKLPLCVALYTNYNLQLLSYRWLTACDREVTSFVRLSDGTFPG